MDELKQSYGDFNSKYPNGKYAIAAFFLTTYIMYEMKREDGEQRSIEELIESLKKS